MASASEPLRVLVVGLNYAPEMIGIAVYTSGTAEGLAAMGHDVRVVAGQPYYPQWRVAAGHPAWRWTRSTENGVQVIRCPHYVPRSPTGIRRLLHHLSFAVSALVPALVVALRYRPDIVFAVAPSIISAPVARMAALATGARSWLHVQDFEVEAALATGLIREGAGARLARWFERGILRSFHRVSSISPKMCERLVDKGVAADKVVEFRNWADVDSIQPLDRPSIYREEWGITTPHVALYSGNIANKQGIETIVEAARLLQHREDLTFVVCGNGPSRARLEAMAEGLTNIQFHDLQPKERLNELLGLATVHLLPQLAGASDLLFPSKLGNMLASGKPVIATADLDSGLAAELRECGTISRPGDAHNLAAAVDRLLDDKMSRDAQGEAGRKMAMERLSRLVVVRQLNCGLAEFAKHMV